MQISNEQLIVKAKAAGAELTSIVNRETGMEYLWQADPKHWNRHAPVLFPIVGRLKENTYLVNGQAYHLNQHGFARDQVFELLEQTSTSLLFELKTNAKLEEIYPFTFRLQIGYELDGPSVKTVYKVFNDAQETLYFSIGGHPAYRCPLQTGEQRHDYKLVFEHDHELITHSLTDGLFTGATQAIPLTDHALTITDALFDQDALVLHQPQSHRISLEGPTGKWFTFHYPEFPYLGIWSKSSEAPFVCLEPWFGLADYTTHDQQIAHKKGIVTLDGGKVFECAYTLEVHQ